jgi:hypothetical protein
MSAGNEEKIIGISLKGEVSDHNGIADEDRSG